MSAVDSASEFTITMKAFFGTADNPLVFVGAAHSTKPHLFVLKQSVLKIVELSTGLEISTWRLPREGGLARKLRMSSDFLYLGVLRNAKTLEIRTLYESEPIHRIVRDQSKSDSILGFEWLPFVGELIVISNCGIEFYVVDSHARFQKKTTILISLNWFIFWPETCILIISSGSSNLFIYRILPKSSYETFPTLSIQARRSEGAFSYQITRKHVQTFTLYDHNYIAFWNSWLRIPTISFYRISTKSQYRKDYELSLQTHGDFCFNVCDNLIFAHNCTTGNSLIFDLKLSTISKSLIEPTSVIFTYLDSLLSGQSSSNDQFDFKTFQPNLIITSQRAFTITPNIKFILQLLMNKGDMTYLQLTEFLVRRKLCSFSLRIIPLIQALMVKTHSLAIRAILGVLSKHHQTLRLAQVSVFRQRSTVSLQSGFSSAESLLLDPKPQDESSSTFSFQDDIFCQVFTPLATTLSPIYLSHILVEFIDYQNSQNTEIKSFIYDLLLHLLFQSKSFVQIHRLIRTNVIPDSSSFANLLIQDHAPTNNNLQLGIDMLKRLDCHHDVLAILTSTNQLLDAIFYAKQAGLIRNLSPAPFLDAALGSGDRTLFLNVYRFFEEHGLIPLASQVDENSYLARYISVFHENFGLLIEMERL